MSKLSPAIQSAVDSLPQTIAAILIPFITVNPALGAPLIAIVGIYGWSVVYRQERLNQLMQSVVDEPDIFTKNTIASSELQDGLITFIDGYFKLRDDSRLAYARAIFRDFAASDNKPLYPLERYNDTLMKLSDASIRFLGFIEFEIPTIKEEYLNSRMRQNSNSFDEQNIINMRKAYIDNEPLSKFVDLWIETEVEKEAKKTPGYGTTLLNVEDPIRKRIKENIGLAVSELEQLGLVRSFSFQTQGWSGGNTVSGYNLTHYGRMFTSVIKPEGADFMV